MASLNIDLPPCTHRYLPLSSCRGASYSRNEDLYLIDVYLFAVLNNAAASILSRPYILKKIGTFIGRIYVAPPPRRKVPHKN